MGQTVPDVRVKLSAEGVDEVVRAFQQVAIAARKSGKDAGGGISLINMALSEMKSLLPAIGLGAAVAGLGELVVSAIESADAIGKLSQKTGVSTEALSALSVAANLADGDFESLSKGLVKFNKTMADLDRGSSQAGASVRRLLGSTTALNGLNTEERLKKVVDAIAKMPAGYDKTRTAQDFFGKSGADLIPMLDELGSGGFEKARQMADRFGLTVDANVSAAAERARQSVKILHLEVQGLATQFSTGFAEPFANAMDELTKTSGPSGMKELGKDVGGVVGWFVKLAGVVATINLGLDVVRDKLVNWANGTPAPTAPTHGSSAWAANFGLHPTQAGGSVPAGPETAKAQLAAAQARLQAELPLFAKQQELVAAQQKIAYENGLENLTTYYDQRAEAIRNGSAKELSVLRRELSLLKSTPIEVTENETDDQVAAKQIKRAQDIEAKKNQIAIAELDGQGKLAANDDARQKAQITFANERISVEREIAEMQGRTFEAAQLAIAKQIDDLKRKGLSTKELERALTLAAQLAEVQRRSGLASGALELSKSGIDTKAASGALFPFQAVEQYDAAVQKALPGMRELAQQRLLLAEATGDPKSIQEAEMEIARIDALGVSADRSARDLSTMKASLESALTGDLENFLDTGIEKAHSLGDAFAGLALSVAKSLQQIVSHILATRAVMALLKLFPGGGGGSLSSGGLTDADYGYADGGVVRGPGTGTSDSVPAMLSAGEFVMRAAVVRQPGMLTTLAELNRGMSSPRLRSPYQIPRFATGGLVSPAERMGGGSSMGGTHVTVEVHPDLVVKQIESGPGARAVVRALQRNRNAANSALGK